MRKHIDLQIQFHKFNISGSQESLECYVICNTVHLRTLKCYCLIERIYILYLTCTLKHADTNMSK